MVVVLLLLLLLLVVVADRPTGPAAGCRHAR